MIYFTPGPSQLYPSIKKHITHAIETDITSISHRSEKFHKIIKDININLKKLLNIPENYSIFFLSSATECMERILENCTHDSSFHFINGAFSKRFYSIAVDLKKNSISHTANQGEGFDFRNIKIPKTTELIAVTQNETSTGVTIPIRNIVKLAENNPQSLIAVDITSSVPYVNLDFSKLDCVFFSIQKGFGLPAGLGVLIVNPKSLEKSKLLGKKGVNIGSYHKFSSMLAQSYKLQTVETPNILGLYLFENVIKDMLKTGIDKIRKLTAKKADLLYSFFENHPQYEIFVKDKDLRSKTVIVINPETSPEKIIMKLKSKDILIGSGYGSFKETQIRIANFPAHTVKNIENLLLSFDNFDSCN